MTKESLLRVHLIPSLGAKRFNTITNEDVQGVKRALQSKAPKTVNNVLSVLSTLLRIAVEWNVIERVPYTIRVVKAPKPSAVFHDFDANRRLVEASKVTGTQAHRIVLFGRGS